MVKRYPHIITIKTGGKVEKDGELVEKPVLSLDLEARFESSSKRYKSENGAEIVISGEIYVNHDKICDAELVILDGVRYRIYDWKKFQSHSVIFVVE